mmetsp:Transcript_22053/g.34281  ORF Transcript_22053/g.34281 Transcript_22053/m.34281 type:complete len:82 (+) Transcript_22053:41-286(+)
MISVQVSRSAGVRNMHCAHHKLGLVAWLGKARLCLAWLCLAFLGLHTFGLAGFRKDRGQHTVMYNGIFVAFVSFFHKLQRV